MLSAKKLAKKQKKAVARQEETKRFIEASKKAVRDLFESIRRNCRHPSNRSV
jgi:hypothetical protein